MGANLGLGASILALTALITTPVWILILCERHLRRLDRHPRRPDLR